jgi:hypothetical protein
MTDQARELLNAAAPERRLDAREARRLKAEDRFLGRLERREAQAERLIGELCREGRAAFYINLRDRSGRLTGKTKEAAPGELIAYLLRNNYV